MKIFHDWEFLDDGSTISPISVGLKAENGRSYYAVFADAPWYRIHQHSWLVQNVLPYLSPDGGPLDLTRSYVKSRLEIRLDVLDLIKGTPKPELWGDYCAYDHVCLAQLWGPMMSLPPEVPMWTNDLRTRMVLMGVTDDDLPKPEGPLHNALADAEQMLAASQWLDWRAHRDILER